MALRTDRNRSKAVLRGAALALALTHGIAPAAADMRFEYGSYPTERRDYRAERWENVPRGCDVHVRAQGWCDGYRVSPGVRNKAVKRLRLREARRLRRQEAPRHLPHGTRIERPHRDDNGLAIALGIAGIATGAIIAGSLSEQRTPRRDHGYEPVATPPPLPRYNDRDAFPDAPRAPGIAAPFEPAPVAPTADPYEPWSTAWLEACRQRYRSFNERTGTFRGYDGRDHFCKGPR